MSKRITLIGLLLLFLGTGSGCCRLYDRWCGGRSTDRCAPPSCSNPCNYGPTSQKSDCDP